MSKNSSDPYHILQTRDPITGSQRKLGRSNTVRRELNPNWDALEVRVVRPTLTLTLIPNPNLNPYPNPIPIPIPTPDQVRVEQLPHLGAQQLRLEVYDQDQLGSDDLIGVTTLELPDLQALHISLYLATSRHISSYLAISRYISLHHPRATRPAGHSPHPPWPYLSLPQPYLHPT